MNLSHNQDHLVDLGLQIAEEVSKGFKPGVDGYKEENAARIEAIGRITAALIEKVVPNISTMG